MGGLSDDFWDDSPPKPAASHAPREKGCRPLGHRFDAPVRVCELDERLRTSSPWPARALELSRSHLVFLSRRMVYHGRTVVVILDLLDDKPTLLCGRVVTCEYDEDGMHRIDMDLVQMPQSESIRKLAEVPKARQHR